MMINSLPYTTEQNSFLKADTRNDYHVVHAIHISRCLKIMYCEKGKFVWLQRSTLESLRALAIRGIMMSGNLQIVVIQRDEPKHAEGYRWKLIEWEKSTPGFYSTYDRARPIGYYHTEANAKRAMTQIEKRGNR